MKKMNVIVMLILGVFCPGGVSLGWGQGVLPPSPEGVALVRAVNYPVGAFTGVADVRVPLCTVGERGDGNGAGVQGEVALGYLGGGVKVQDVAGCVGLGWRLCGGGKVTRVVRQYPDEEGWCAGDGAVTGNVAGWTAASLKERVEGGFDSEPDVFYYELGDRRGKFVLDAAGNAWTVPYRRLRIEWVDREYFLITDEEGTRFTLGREARERSRYVFADGREAVECVSTWHLERVETLGGGRLELTYEEGTDLEYALYGERYVGQVEDGSFVSSSEAASGALPARCAVTVAGPRYLKSIDWRSGRLEFCYSAQAWVAFGRKLDEIKVFSMGDYRKSVKFAYGYFAGEEGVEGRLRLERVWEYSYLRTQQLGRFEYYEEGGVLPARNSPDFDHGGYYNAAGNVTGRPTFRVGTAVVAGADREPDVAAARLGMLRRKYDHWGGCEEYAYELHQTAAGAMCGLRLQSVTQSPGGYVTDYTYADWEDEEGCSGVRCVPEAGYAYTRMEGGGVERVYGVVEAGDVEAMWGVEVCPVGYGSVIVRYPNTSRRVYRYAVAGDAAAEVDDLSGGGVVDGGWCVWSGSSQEWKRGLLLSVTDYGVVKWKTKEEIFHYKTDAAVKRTVVGVRPELLALGGGEAALSGRYRWESQAVWMDSVHVVGSSVVEESTAYAYHADYLVPVEVRRRVNGEVYRTVYRYPFDYGVGSAAASAGKAYALRVMLEGNRVSAPVEVVTYRNGKVVEGEVYEYRVIPTEVSGRSVAVDNVRRLLTAAPLDSYTAYSVNAGTGATVCDANYREGVFADRYDGWGNMVQFHALNGNYTTVVYGYGHTLPVAVVEHANTMGAGTAERWSEVYYTSFEEEEGAVMMAAKTGRRAWKGVYAVDLGALKPGKYKLTYWRSKDEGKTWGCVTDELVVSGGSTTYSVGSASYCIDEVSVLPPDALMTTCSYLPGAGVLSETDASGVTTYYEYDLLGRLVKMLNGKREVLKSWNYTVQP